MSRCTLATAANAASTAASMAGAGAAATAISTKVPSRGRARRMLAHVPEKWIRFSDKDMRPCERSGAYPDPFDRDALLAGAVAIGRQDPLHALGDVQRRQGGTGNIADVASDLEGTAARFADELRQPSGLAYLAAIRFAVLQDIDPHHPPAGVESHRIVDIEM